MVSVVRGVVVVEAVSVVAKVEVVESTGKAEMRLARSARVFRRSMMWNVFGERNCKLFLILPNGNSELWPPVAVSVALVLVVVIVNRKQ